MYTMLGPSMQTLTFTNDSFQLAIGTRFLCHIQASSNMTNVFYIKHLIVKRDNKSKSNLQILRRILKSKLNF